MPFGYNVSNLDVVLFEPRLSHVRLPTVGSPYAVKSSRLTVVDLLVQCISSEDVIEGFRKPLLTLGMCVTQPGARYHQGLCRAPDVAKQILNTNVSGFATATGQTLRMHLSHH